MGKQFTTDLSHGEIATLSWAVAQAEVWIGTYSGDVEQESAYMNICRDARTIIKKLKEQKKGSSNG